MTKEEILSKSLRKNRLSEDSYPNIMEAMDEWAKEVASNYAHWLLNRMFPYTKKGKIPRPEADHLFNSFQKETE